MSAMPELLEHGFRVPETDAEVERFLDRYFSWSPEMSRTLRGLYKTYRLEGVDVMTSLMKVLSHMECGGGEK